MIAILLQTFWLEACSINGQVLKRVLRQRAEAMLSGGAPAPAGVALGGDERPPGPTMSHAFWALRVGAPAP